MRVWFFLAVLSLVVLVACAPGDDATSSMVRMVLPEGDAVAGQQAFAEFKCVTCHAVKGTKGLPAVESTEPGPDLGISLRGLSRGAIATSIVAPNHVNVESVEMWTELTPDERVWLGPGQIPPRQKADRERSRMREYSGVMTIRELTDLVTFLRSAANSG